jgi:5-methylcytosine-specific restriction endonuclease McrA
MRAQNGLCTLCGHRFAPVGELSDEVQIEYAAMLDHVIPRSHGEDELSNFRLSHFRCNVARGDGNGSNRQRRIRECCANEIRAHSAQALLVTAVDVSRSIEHLGRLLQNSHPFDK